MIALDCYYSLSSPWAYFGGPQLRANSAEAVERGVFGAPTYILDGERFWGQDRLVFLDRALDRLRASLLLA